MLQPTRVVFSSHDTRSIQWTPLSYGMRGWRGSCEASQVSEELTWCHIFHAACWEQSLVTSSPVVFDRASTTPGWLQSNKQCEWPVIPCLSLSHGPVSFTHRYVASAGFCCCYFIDLWATSIFCLLPDQAGREHSFWGFFFSLIPNWGKKIALSSPKCSWVKGTVNTGCQDLLWSVLPFLYNSESIKSILRLQIFLGFSSLSSVARRSRLTGRWGANWDYRCEEESLACWVSQIGRGRRCLSGDFLYCAYWKLKYSNFEVTHLILLNRFLCVAHVQLRFSQAQNRTLS